MVVLGGVCAGVVYCSGEKLCVVDCSVSCHLFWCVLWGCVRFLDVWRGFFVFFCVLCVGWLCSVGLKIVVWVVFGCGLLG